MQHYTVYLFLENCSIFFGLYLHPSSGAHTTVFTVSGTCQTVTATGRYCGRVEYWDKRNHSRTPSRKYKASRETIYNSYRILQMTL